MRKLCGVGVCDIASSENGNKTKCYDAWNNMLKRCYDNKYHERYKSYVGCLVSPEWQVFSNFKEFYDANYKEGFQLDKDLLIPGNKVYSKDTCRFIPSCVNNLFTDHATARGKYPIGVNYNNTNNKRAYRAQLRINGNQTNLGQFATIEEASNAYKAAKKDYCILVANREYDAGNIPLEIRDAIINRANML